MNSEKLRGVTSTAIAIDDDMVLKTDTSESEEYTVEEGTEDVDSGEPKKDPDAPVLNRKQRRRAASIFRKMVKAQTREKMLKDAAKSLKAAKRSSLNA